MEDPSTCESEQLTEQPPARAEPVRDASESKLNESYAQRELQRRQSSSVKVKASELALRRSLSQPRAPTPQPSNCDSPHREVWNNRMVAPNSARDVHDVKRSFELRMLHERKLSETGASRAKSKSTSRWEAPSAASSAHSTSSNRPPPRGKTQTPRSRRKVVAPPEIAIPPPASRPGAAATPRHPYYKPTPTPNSSQSCTTAGNSSCAASIASGPFAPPPIVPGDTYELITPVSAAERLARAVERQQQQQSPTMNKAECEPVKVVLSPKGEPRLVAQNPTGVHDRAQVWLARREIRLQQQRAREAQRIMTECTFQPKHVAETWREQKLRRWAENSGLAAAPAARTSRSLSPKRRSRVVVHGEQPFGSDAMLPENDYPFRRFLPQKTPRQHADDIGLAEAGRMPVVQADLAPDVWWGADSSSRSATSMGGVSAYHGQSEAAALRAASAARPAVTSGSFARVHARVTGQSLSAGTSPRRRMPTNQSQYSDTISSAIALASQLFGASPRPTTSTSPLPADPPAPVQSASRPESAAPVRSKSVGAIPRRPSAEPQPAQDDQFCGDPAQQPRSPVRFSKAQHTAPVAAIAAPAQRQARGRSSSNRRRRSAGSIGPAVGTDAAVVSVAGKRWRRRSESSTQSLHLSDLNASMLRTGSHQTAHQPAPSTRRQPSGYRSRSSSATGHWLAAADTRTTRAQREANASSLHKSALQRSRPSWGSAQFVAPRSVSRGSSRSRLSTTGSTARRRTPTPTQTAFDQKRRAIRRSATPGRRPASRQSHRTHTDSTAASAVSASMDWASTSLRELQRRTASFTARADAILGHRGAGGAGSERGRRPVVVPRGPGEAAFQPSDWRGSEGGSEGVVRVTVGTSTEPNSPTNEGEPVGEDLAAEMDASVLQLQSLMAEMEQGSGMSQIESRADSADVGRLR